MTTAAPNETFHFRNPPYRLNLRQYHQMIEGGLLPEGEPYELIDGQIVRKDRSATGEDPMTVGNQHIWVVKKLAKLGRELDRLGCHMQTQQPIALPPNNEPEPDAAIITGSEDDYIDAKPTAGDVLCVIEVADSSLNYDRTTKHRIYASFGIKQYVIVNLADRVIEVYTEPLKDQHRYGRSETLKPGRQLTLATAKGQGLSLPVRRFLP